MNIFILDDDPVLIAQYHVNRHIVKMPLETAQLLCNAHHICGSNYQIPYKLTHASHPITKWIGLSKSNYIWLVNLGFELCKEYTFRYEKEHVCQKIIGWCSDNIPNLPNCGTTEFIKAMPIEYKVDSVVDSYRNYYNGAKRHLFCWKNRKQPWWIKNEE